MRPLCHSALIEQESKSQSDDMDHDPVLADRRGTTLLVTLAILAAVIVGCGQQPLSDTNTTTTSASAPLSSPTTSASTTSVSPTTTLPVVAATCAPENLRRAIDVLVPSAEFPVREVKVYACRGGIAWVVVMRDPGTENQPMWLKVVDRSWTLVGVGTGIGCGTGPFDSPGSPAMTQACAVLDETPTT